MKKKKKHDANVEKKNVLNRFTVTFSCFVQQILLVVHSNSGAILTSVKEFFKQQVAGIFDETKILIHNRSFHGISILCSWMAGIYSSVESVTKLTTVVIPAIFFTLILLHFAPK